MKKIFCLCMMVFLSSCSIVDTESSAGGLNINSWDEYDISGITEASDFNVQKIGDDIYVLLVSRLGWYSEYFEVYKITYDRGVETKLLLSMAYDYSFNIGDVRLFLLHGKIALFRKRADKNAIDVYSIDNITTLTLLVSDIFSGYLMTLDQINVWVGNDGRTRIAIVEADTRIVVGKFDADNTWSIESTTEFGYNITNFEVKMGENYPYAIWTRQSVNKMIMAVYDFSSTLKNPWTELSSLNNIATPSLLVESYNSLYTGRPQEDVFVGTINSSRGEFQLYALDKNKQLNYTVEYITGDNADYVIANNLLG